MADEGEAMEVVAAPAEGTTTEVPMPSAKGVAEQGKGSHSPSNAALGNLGGKTELVCGVPMDNGLSTTPSDWADAAVDKVGGWFEGGGAAAGAIRGARPTVCRGEGRATGAIKEAEATDATVGTAVAQVGGGRRVLGRCKRPTRRAGGGQAMVAGEESAVSLSPVQIATDESATPDTAMRGGGEWRTTRAAAAAEDGRTQVGAVADEMEGRRDGRCRQSGPPAARRSLMRAMADESSATVATAMSRAAQEGATRATAAAAGAREESARADATGGRRDRSGWGHTWEELQQVLRGAEEELEQREAAAKETAAWVRELRAEGRKRFARERLARREQEERERQEERRLLQGRRGQAERACSSRQSRTVDEPMWLQEAERDAAALRLQAHVRVQAARRRSGRRASAEEGAAARLQGAARDRRARAQAAGERAAREEVAAWVAARSEEAVLAVAIEAVEEAATQLQAAVRGWVARRQVAGRKAERERHGAAGTQTLAARRPHTGARAGPAQPSRAQERERKTEAQKNVEERRRQMKAGAADERASRRERQAAETRAQQEADAELWGLMCRGAVDQLESAVRRLQGVASLEVRAAARTRMEAIRRGMQARRVQVTGDARHARVLQKVLNVRDEETLVAAAAAVSALPQAEAAGLEEALAVECAGIVAAQGGERTTACGQGGASRQCLEGPQGRTAQGPYGASAQARAIGRDTGSRWEERRGPSRGVPDGARRERHAADEGTGAGNDSEGCTSGIRNEEEAGQHAPAIARVLAAEWLAAERARVSAQHMERPRSGARLMARARERTAGGVGIRLLR